MSDQPAGACPQCGTGVTSPDGIRFWCGTCQRHVPGGSLLGARPSDKMPGRSLEYARPHPSGLEALCDCGCLTILTVDPEDIRRLPHAQETSFTCDGCQSVHWLTISPAGDQP